MFGLFFYATDMSDGNKLIDLTSIEVMKLAGIKVYSGA
tara:strand:+ start:211 stop:324 length:114 start_codon:yes stop_codon:yes gene_type:complete